MNVFLIKITITNTKVCVSSRKYKMMLGFLRAYS